jgi:Icc-related predicted phosphoesterase
MEIREISDVHNEFQVLSLPVSQADSERTLILAGDIDAAQNAERNVNWINEYASFFKHVIYIFGNHEFYHGDHDQVIDFYKNRATWKNNVHVLNHEALELDGVVFWGGTLWTSLKEGKDWGLMARVRRGMNDFRLIQKTTDLKTSKRLGDKFDPYDMVEIFMENKPNLFATVAKARAEGKKSVVITHHAPCSPSIARHFRGHDMNDAYCMYIDKEVEDNGPDVWFHGHTHVSNSYVIGRTDVWCNPRGYAGYEENPGFNPYLVVEV